MAKNKKVSLLVSSNDAYFLACFLTGRKEGTDSSKERERQSKNIVELLRKMDWEDRYKYHTTLLSMDWSKVPEMKPHLEKMSKAITKKNVNVLTASLALLLSCVR